jgi:sporulation protein YlmC with PRC-barrel domain
MKTRLVPAALAVFLLTALAPSALAVKRGEAKFIGGTITTVREDAEGPISLTNEKRLTFMPKGSETLEIPWDRVSQLEYGQKVTRRKTTALLSKSRRHYVTITYQDQEKVEQAVVLEFDHDDVRMVLASLKARTLQTIIFQDEEARREMGGVVEKK